MKANKIFTFLKENNILVEIKTSIIKILNKKREEFKPVIALFLNDKSPKIKEIVANYIIKEIELPLYLKPFKFVVKNVINKNIDKIIKFIIDII